MFAHASILIFSFASHYSNQEKPAALVQAELAASRIQTARIEFTIRESSESTRFYTWRCAGGDVISDYHGDQQQVLWRDENGNPIPTDALGNSRTLYNGADVWTYYDNDLHAGVSDPRDASPQAVFDIRRVGINPIDPSLELEEQRKQAGYGPFEYSTEEENGMFVVTARVKETDGALKWWIDPTKDWCVTKTAVFMNHREIGEAQYELAQKDGIWIPVEIRQIPMGDDPANTTPNRIVKVIYAEFNRPDHPKRFSPSDIGVEPGTRIEFVNRPAPIADAVWNGSELTSGAAFREKVARGEAAYGPTLSRILERLQITHDEEQRNGVTPAAEHATARSRKFESEWEAYTRRFIEKYGLDEEQTQAAWRVCRQCQERGREWVARKSTEFAAVDKLLSNPETSERGKSELDRLIGPIDRIFEEQLKPRLERIPTKAQRAKGDEETLPAASKAGDAGK